MPFNAPPQLEFAYHADGRQKFLRGRRVFKLSRDFVYTDLTGALHPISVPGGFESELATIPTLPLAIGAAVLGMVINWLATAWLGDLAAAILGVTFIAVVAVVVGYLRHDGPWAAAAIVHDWLYGTSHVSRRMADAIFLEIMLETGVHPVVAHVMFAAVRLCGWMAYGKPIKWVPFLGLVLLCASPAAAERRVVVFTDPSYCPHCRRLEATFARPAVREAIAERRLELRVVNSSNCSPELLDKYRVRTIPATFLFEIDGDRAELLGRINGAMSEPELLDFLKGPK